jgi:hypothetical protein
MHSFALRYEQLITWIVSACPAPDKFAHTYAGLGLWLGAAILLRRPLRSPLPLAIVIVLEVANECVDRVAHGGWMWHDTLGDAGATWFWPIVLTAALRRVVVLRR